MPDAKPSLEAKEVPGAARAPRLEHLPAAEPAPATERVPGTGSLSGAGLTPVTDPAPILFAGDPHRNFAPILRACAAHPPGTLILLGDCDLPAPLHNVLAPATSRGWRVFWILGNHDTETEAAYDNLTQSPGDLGLRVETICGVRIAGLPGIFKPRVWDPRDGVPSFHTRAAFQTALRSNEPWRGGLPLFHRDTLFPEDFDCLARQRCDILVSHEAPSSHRHGYAEIDALAVSCGARLIVHGHHHQSYTARLPNGIQVRGLGLSEPWLYPGQQ